MVLKFVTAYCDNSEYPDEDILYIMDGTLTFTLLVIFLLHHGRILIEVSCKRKRSLYTLTKNRNDPETKAHYIKYCKILK
jgi:ribosomal protein L33